MWAILALFIITQCFENRFKGEGFGVHEQLLVVALVVSCAIQVNAKCPFQCRCSSISDTRETSIYREDEEFSVTLVNCSGSGLTRLPAADDLEDVMTFIASHNGLKHLLKNDLKRYAFVSLENLDLSHNRLVYIDKNTFESDGNVQLLDLSHNSLRDIPPETFRPIAFSLESLSLSDNPLLRSSDGKLSPTCFHALKYLNLDSCRIGNLTDELLFDRFPNLQHVSLSNNSIANIEGSFFRYLSSLITINLSRNELISLCDKVFSPLTNLVSLDLSHNSFHRVSAGIFQPLFELKELNLSGNNWSCGCDLYGLFLYCKNRGVKSKVVCSSPESVTGDFWHVSKRLCLQATKSRLPSVTVAMSSTSETVTSGLVTVRRTILNISVRALDNLTTENSSSASTELIDVHMVRPTLTSDVDAMEFSPSLTAIIVVSAFVFLTIFSVFAYAMRIRRRHQTVAFRNSGVGYELRPYVANIER